MRSAVKERFILHYILSHQLHSSAVNFQKQYVVTNNPMVSQKAAPKEKLREKCRYDTRLIHYSFTDSAKNWDLG